MAGVHAYKEYFWVNIAKAFPAGSYPKLEAIKQTFDGKQVLTLASGETITLVELKSSGVSATQTVARIFLPAHEDLASASHCMTRPGAA